jgi:hypothetical protein
MEDGQNLHGVDQDKKMWINTSMIMLTMKITKTPFTLMTLAILVTCPLTMYYNSYTILTPFIAFDGPLAKRFDQAAYRRA